jgi:hypothetical protein
MFSDWTVAITTLASEIIHPSPLPSVFFSWSEKGRSVQMRPPSHHVQLALYADDTAIIATSRKATLLISYLESYLNDLQRWLCEWRIAINVSKGAFRR